VWLGLGHAQFLARRHMQDFASEALVAEQGADLLEAGKAPMAVLVPEEGGIGRVQLVVEGVGVLVEGRVLRLGAGTAMGGNVGDRLELSDGGHDCPERWFSATIGKRRRLANAADHPLEKSCREIVEPVRNRSSGWCSTKETEDEIPLPCLFWPRCLCRAQPRRDARGR